MIGLDKAIELARQYPELSAILGGTALSWAPGLTLETWVLPETWTDRKIRQVTLGVTVAIAAITTNVLWNLFDSTPESRGIVVLLSGAAALSAPAIHVAAAAVLTHFFPYLDSVFKFKGKQDVPKPNP